MRHPPVTWYLHLDMDAFYASVEQALNPSLRGKAVIVGGGGARGVVTSASYEARRFGVRSAMPAFQARKLCPHGIFLPGNRRAYRDFSRRVFLLLERYSPRVQARSIDEGVLDLTGTERLFGPPLKTADTIIRRIQDELGLPSSAGLATDRRLAKIAATLAKPHGLIFVPAGAEIEFLRPLEPALIPGIGPKAQNELERQGIETIGELLHRPELAARYLGFGGGSRSGPARDHSVGAETTLDRPLTAVTDMECLLWNLVEQVGSRLREEETPATRLTLKVRYGDFKTVTRSRTLASPTCFDREIFAVVQGLLRESLVRGRPVRLLGVTAGVPAAPSGQESLFGGQRVWGDLYRAIDRLRQKYGTEAVRSAGTKD